MKANTKKLTAVALGVAAALGHVPSWGQVVPATSVTSGGNLSIDVDTNVSHPGVEALSITASGVTTLTSTSTNTTVFTPLTVAGATTLQGNNALGGAGATNTITGTNTLSGTNALTGTNNLSNVTNITGTNTLSGTNALTGTTNLSNITNITGTNTITGATSINTTGNTTTTIGNALNQTFLNSATNSIGGSGSYATVNNIGVGAANASTNTIGNTNAASTVSSYGGASYNTLTNAAATMGTGTGGMVQTDAASASIRASSTGALASNGTTGVMAVNAGGGYSAYATSQNTGTATIGGVVNNKQYTNKISGNTYIDGNLYINGTLDYVSSNSANTTVIGSTTASSVLPSATQAVTAGTAIVAKGSTGTQTVVDSHGKLMNVTGTATESTAALTLTNGLGNTHGLVVTETQATLSGGTRSSSLTLADNGATFSDAQTGGPVQVHGVNDGKGDFDAVNVRQFSGAIASVTAMANIPYVDQDGKYSVGVGLGSFMGKNAVAAGMSYRFTRNGVFKASMSSAFTRADTDTFGMGAAWSF